jgi:hypothetical protein
LLFIFSQQNAIAITQVFVVFLLSANSFLFVFQDSCGAECGVPGLVEGQLRSLLSPRVYTLPLVRSIGKTMVQGKNCGPQITVQRLSTRRVIEH